MTVADPPRVAALVAAAPEVDARARAAILDDAGSRLATAGGVLLATCHRVEWFGAEPQPRVPGMRPLTGVDAARHVIRLALGLGSAVLAEDQILHQLRAAVTASRRRHRLPPDLDLLLDHAMRAGRTGRSWRPPMATSLADRALDRIEATIGSLDGRGLLIVGAGEMGRLLAHGASRRGSRLAIASRSPERAAVLAAQVRDATAVALDPGPRALGDMDAVVIAMGGRWATSAATSVVLAERAVVVDLSMPPALDPAVRLALGARGLDIDGIRGDELGSAVERRYRDRLEVLAAATIDRYLEAVAERRRSHADLLAARIERQRTDALAAYLGERPELDPATRAELDRLTRDLSARFFREPLARLAADPDGRRRRALDELFGW